MTPAPSPLRQVVALAGFLAACLTIGALGSLVTAQSVATWYTILSKPSFNPPNWVFAPVWTTLYLLMAVAAWLVWRAAGWSSARFALQLFFAQLSLNFLWSLLFFGVHQIALALIDVILLLTAIAATTLAFRNHSRLAAILLLPYLAWVTFAAVLNAAIWRLN